jgi:hypothetical protein
MTGDVSRSHTERDRVLAAHRALDLRGHLAGADQIACWTLEEAAGLIGVPITTLWRKTSKAILGLAPISIEYVFHTNSGIAKEGQIQEFRLSCAANASVNALAFALDEAVQAVAILKRRQRRERDPSDLNEEVERALDTGAIASLDAQIRMYRKQYPEAFSYFLQAFKISNSLAESAIAEHAEQILSVRSGLNAFAAAYEADEIDDANLSSPQRLRTILPMISRRRFTQRVSDVTCTLKDPRLAYNLAEALGFAGRSIESARFLKLSMRIDLENSEECLQPRDWFPDWLTQPATDVPYLAEAVRLIEDEEV